MSEVFAHHDFRRDQFPVTLRFFRESDGVKVWERVITSPGDGLGSLQIPPLADEHGPVIAEIETADGEKVRSDE